MPSEKKQAQAEEFAATVRAAGRAAARGDTDPRVEGVIDAVADIDMWYEIVVRATEAAARTADDIGADAPSPAAAAVAEAASAYVPDASDLELAARTVLEGTGTPGRSRSTAAVMIVLIGFLDAALTERGRACMAELEQLPVKDISSDERYAAEERLIPQMNAGSDSVEPLLQEAVLEVHGESSTFRRLRSTSQAAKFSF